MIIRCGQVERRYSGYHLIDCSMMSFLQVFTGAIFRVDEIIQFRLHYSQIFKAAISYYLLFKQFNEA